MDTPVSQPAPTTKPWMSKTLLMSALTVLLPATWPAAAAWIAANPAAFSALLGGAFAALRMVTRGRISIAD